MFACYGLLSGYFSSIEIRFFRISGVDSNVYIVVWCSSKSNNRSIKPPYDGVYIAGPSPNPPNLDAQAPSLESDLSSLEEPVCPALLSLYHHQGRGSTLTWNPGQSQFVCVVKHCGAKYIGREDLGQNTAALAKRLLQMPRQS